MRFFIDTEFNQASPRAPIELISIALISELGAELYCVNREFTGPATPFVGVHVLPQLPPVHERDDLATIQSKLFNFIGDETPIFIGRCASFDYVVLSNLVGTFDQWPHHWPTYIEDLQPQLDFMHGEGIYVPDCPSEAPHHALADARAVRDLYYELIGVSLGPAWAAD